MSATAAANLSRYAAAQLSPVFELPPRSRELADVDNPALGRLFLPGRKPAHVQEIVCGPVGVRVHVISLTVDVQSSFVAIPAATP